MATLKLQLEVGSVISLANNPSFKSSLSEHLGNKSLLSMSDDALREYLSPKPEDYVMIPMRALSATSVQSDSINFGHNNGAALMAAVKQFNGLTILKDHDMRVDNWSGVTQDAYWDTSTTGAPPGVNFMLKIDSKKDPDLARGLLSGALNSGSVTVEFDYDKSHPKMKDYEFGSQLGTVVDNVPVQALVTSITRLYEYSVVWSGADKFAKTIKDGKIDTPGTKSNSLSLEKPLNKKLLALLKLPDTATEQEIAAALEAHEAALAATNTSLATVTAEKTSLSASITTKDTEVTTLTANLATKTTETATLSAQVATLTAEKTVLTTEVASLRAGATAFAVHLTARRAEAARLYALAEGTNALAPMKATMETASLELAESFITTFGAKVESTMPLACTKCHSTEVSRRISKQAEPGTTEDSGSKTGAERLKSSVTSIHSS